MKYLIILFALFFSIQSIQAQSENARQDSTAQQGESTEISDEELEKYAITMDSVNDMKASLLEAITVKVKSNEKLTNARYNELSKIIDDEAALVKAKAKPEEIAFIKEVVAMKEEGTAKIQETFQSMAQEYVGASSYNKIKSALTSDEEVKKRYEAQMAKLGTTNTGVN